MTIKDVTYPDDFEPDEENRKRLWVGEIDSILTDKRYVHNDGHVVWVSLVVSAVREANGSVIHILAQIQDVTERIRTEKTLNLQAAALESAANAIAILDSQRNIMWVNPAFTDLTGYTAEEAIGQNTSMLNSDEGDSASYQDVRDTTSSGRVWQGEVIHRRKDGTNYPEEMTVTPVKDADGEITNFISIKQDITERKQLEAQLLHAQKMESIGTLAGGVAHDFNNLLTGILGYSQFGLTVSSDDRVRGFFQEIGKAGERAASLTRQLLAFSRQEIVRPKILNLNDSIIETDKMLRRLIGEDIEMVTLIAPDIGSVKVDPGQIEQVLINLAVNARDAMPEGGKLTIETANVSFDYEYVRHHSMATVGKYVMLRVSDTGFGMTEEVRARVFEPFFTTKEMGKGTGLGLSTCYGIVSQSGGFITVDSEPDRGTTFKVYLPSVEEAVSLLTEPAGSRQSPRGTETVLVVEDEPVVRELVTIVLEELGYNVLEADNGTHAMNVAQNADEEIDLLVTDVVMPFMGGRQLAGQLKELHPEARILFISGHSNDVMFRHGVLHEGAEFIQKPFTPEVLARSVREVLDRQ